MQTAVRAGILAAFTARQGYSADAAHSAGAWLMHRTGVTRGAAAGHLGWMRRAVAHPQVAVALAEGTVLSESVARKLCVRWHDALEDAMRRLIAAGLLPERAGQPVRAWVHVSLAELRAMDEDSALERQWVVHVSGRWAAARAGASVAGGDSAAWLDGDAARGMCCDSSLTPVVTGEVDVAALDEMVMLCVKLARLGHCGRDTAGPGQDRAGGGRHGAAGDQARGALQQAVIGKAVDLLSGPGGLASFLRTRELGARLGGPSLPLDIGYSDDVPFPIRRAVTLRARGHCEWPGGCRQHAAACQVHHVRHRADGGLTSTGNCVLLCFFHHQVAIHRQGWRLVLHPDGTTTAWNPGKTTILHSHGPPPRLG